MSGKGMIKVYVCSIPDAAAIDEKVVRTFPEYRRERIHSAGSPRVKASNYAAGMLLRDILDVRADGDIVFSDKGKPYLADGRRYFSLSHDGRHVVLAVGDCELGTDAEAEREIKESVKKRVFSDEEMVYCAGDKKKAVFLWTRLEAVLKLSGEGIGGIKKRSFSLLKDDWIFIRSAEYDGSFISVACGEPFDMEISEYQLLG